MLRLLHCANNLTVCYVHCSTNNDVLPYRKTHHDLYIPTGSETGLHFTSARSANNIVIDKAQVDALKRYHDELLYWNKKVNMISRKDEENVWERHILHSLTLMKYVTFPQKARVLDVGTGGGLPGPVSYTHLTLPTSDLV